MLSILVDVLFLEAEEEEEEEAEHAEEDGGGEGGKTQDKSVWSQISWAMNTKKKQWNNNQGLVLEAVLLLLYVHALSCCSLYSSLPISVWVLCTLY